MEDRAVLSVDEQLKVITSGTMQVVPMDELRKKLEKGTPLNIKLGVDPTSPDLHLGHAVPLRKMRQFQDLGHKVTLIIGNGTALIGDPSGRDSTRPPLTEEQVEANAQTYVEQAMKVLDPEKTTIVHNGDWIKPLNLGKMLSLMSKFNVARILEREDFHNRYTNGQSIALHEFIYPVLQAYDSVVIDADVEMGGNDQIFNLLAGRDLMRAEGMEPQVALTVPLLVGTDGVKKMSKSYGNAISLCLTEEETWKLIKKSKTDSERMITFDKENRPGVSALLTTAALCTGRSEVEIAEEIGEGGSGALKKYVNESVNSYLAPLRERRRELESQMDYIHDVLADGNRRANEIANETLAEVREAMHMVY